MVRNLSMNDISSAVYWFPLPVAVFIIFTGNITLCFPAKLVPIADGLGQGRSTGEQLQTHSAAQRPRYSIIVPKVFHLE